MADISLQDRTELKPIRVDATQTYHCRYGQFPHKDMIGMPFGSQMSGRKNGGFVYLLRMTPELWTQALPHRTQIVYTPDISFICTRLRLRPGMRMVEAGTGSGSATHAYARTLGRKGRLLSFEFHQQRYETAHTEFAEHGLLESHGGNTKLTHRDVCSDGFAGVEGEPDCLALHAVFLDLPAPWLALPHLDRHISETRQCRVCCFLPCIEQVQRTITALKENEWHDIELHEVMYKQHEVKKLPIRTVDEMVSRLIDIDRKRREGSMQFHRKRKAGQLEDNLAQDSENGVDDLGEKANDSPRKSADEVPEKDAEGETEQSRVDTSEPQTEQEDEIDIDSHGWERKIRRRVVRGAYIDPRKWRDVTRVEPTIRGHTSYLLFAAKIPRPPQSVSFPDEYVREIEEEVAEEEL